MDQLRKIIRETISNLLEVESAFDGSKEISQNIDKELGDDLNFIQTSVKKQTQDVKNADNKIKADTRVKNQLPNDAPERKGLEVELPLKTKELANKKAQIGDLKKSEDNLTAAKKKIEDQQKAIEKQNLVLKAQQRGTTSTTSSSQQTSGVLPSLPSAI